MTAAEMNAVGSALRIVPPGRYAGRSHIVLERAFRVYSKSWLLILTGFFEPLFYLFSLGNGLKTLVGTVVGPGGHPISYAAYIAPALLAASAMNKSVPVLVQVLEPLEVPAPDDLQLVRQRARSA